MHRRALLAPLFFFAVCLAPTARAQTQATALPLRFPAATVFDAQGNLYFAESGNHAIRKLTPSGVVSTVAGTGVQGFAGDNGPATAAELDSPAGLALDSVGNLFIADTHNHRIREVSAATGTIATIAGTGVPGFSGDGGPATAAQLDLPTALALDPAGNLYIADTRNHHVRRIAASTGAISTVAGNGIQTFAGDTGPATAASIDSPNGLALDSVGNLYIADTHNGRVRRVNAATGTISTVAGVRIVAGNLQAFAGDTGPATAAALALPRGLAMDSAGNLYLADSANQRIRRISPSGVISTVAGQGTQAFTGDNAPAIAASLDAPRSVAVSPAGLLTLADTGNQRVRQLDAQPAPGPDIHTIAGLGTTTPGVLTLSGPSVVAYGSGTLTATLAAATPATGSLTLFNTGGATQTALGSATLNANSATFSTASLAAAAYTLVASYPGDATHGAAQSSAVALAVAPLALAATANPASALYGQPVPALSGALTGVLPRDAGNVAALFTSTATAVSPVGHYPIAATLAGSAARNYTVAVAPPAYLAIAHAPTLTTLSASTNDPGLGLPITLAVQSASTTSGVPTGTVALLDAGTSLAVVPLSPTGAASFTTSSLALGAHTLSATYSGDANFLPSSSATANVAVGPASDFTLASTGSTSQAVPLGSAATYTFSVAMLGAALSSPIALAVQGLPAGSTASLNPSYIPPGGAITRFTLTVQTPLLALNRTLRPLVSGAFPPSSSAPPPPPSSGLAPHGLLAILLLPAIALARCRPRHRPRRRPLRRSPGGIPARRRPSLLRAAFAAASCLLLATLAIGCGNRISTASEFANATSYTLTVTATATGTAGNALQHSTTVTLQILQQ